jgi:Spy/CpxP family protein refolding chaperone
MRRRKVMQMRKQLFLIVPGIALYLALFAATAQAHHAFGAEYDANRPVTLRGTVTKLEWVNPHALIYIESKKSSGVVEQWAIEAASPNTLTNRGFTRDIVKLGMDVTVNGYQSKSGALRVHGRDLTLPSGQVLPLGSPGIGAPYDDASLAQEEQKLAVVRSQLAGAWWMNTALMQRLGITDEQIAKIERTFENHRQAILSTTDQLEKEEGMLSRLLDAEPIDRNAVFTQIDRVIQARSEMERANAVMTLEMREHLTRAQWEQLPRTNNAIRTGGRGGRAAVPVPVPVPGQRRGRGQ